MSNEEIVLELKNLVDAQMLKLNALTDHVTNCAEAETILKHYNEIMNDFKEYSAGQLEKITDAELKQQILNYGFQSLNKKADELNSLAENVKHDCAFKKTNSSEDVKKIPGYYDQVVRGDIKIKKIKNNNNEYDHKITFCKNGKFLLYQVWNNKEAVEYTFTPEHRGRSYTSAVEYRNDPKNADKIFKKTIPVKMNDDRSVKYLSAKEWVVLLNGIPGFTPTTVMEIGIKKYVFVIKKYKLNKNDKLIFYISTKEVKLDKKMKHLKKIPKGEYKNVRFDVDSSTQKYSCGNNDPNETCWCENPNTYVLATLGDKDQGYIGTCGIDCSEFGYSHNFDEKCYSACNSSKAPTFICGRCTGWWAGDNYTPPYIPYSFNWNTCATIRYFNSDSGGIGPQSVNVYPIQCNFNRINEQYECTAYGYSNTCTCVLPPCVPSGLGTNNCVTV